MRELTIKLRFTRWCLGSVPANQPYQGCLLLPRNPRGQVTFLASWHRANMKVAAQLLGRHQDEVDKILWDIAVDGTVRDGAFYRRYYANSKGRRRFVLHECFFAGQVVGVHCAVPNPITDGDFRKLMDLVGKYRGISPYNPGEWGFFEVAGLQPRSGPEASQEGIVTQAVEQVLNPKG